MVETRNVGEFDRRGQRRLVIAGVVAQRDRRLIRKLADEIAAAASYILTGVLDIANSVTVNLADTRLEVEVSGSKLPYEDIWYYRCLGSPIASIVAAISSEALQKPVRIREESYGKGKARIVLEVLS